MNVEALLLAIAMVESNNDPNAVGRHGERSQYQITRAVFAKHAPKVNFSKAQPWMFKSVALKHVFAIRKSLPVENSASPFWIAVQWNGGRGAVLHSKMVSAHVRKPVREYADRVRAMYEVYKNDARCKH